jgi:hypothetical protein
LSAGLALLRIDPYRNSPESPLPAFCAILRSGLKTKEAAMKARAATRRQNLENWLGLFFSFGGFVSMLSVPYWGHSLVMLLH